MATVKSATQLKTALMPIVQPEIPQLEAKITDSSMGEFASLRKARSDKRLKGIRDKVAKQKAEEEASKKK